MSKAQDYLKATIAELGEERAAEFWTTYRELQRLDNRDSEARLKRRYLAHSLSVLNRLKGEGPYEIDQRKRHEARVIAYRAWLQKHGYTE